MTTVNEARDRIYLHAVILLDIELLNGGGTVYFSDRTIDVGANSYQAYILNASNIIDSIKRENSKGDNPAVTIRFINKPFRTYDYLSLINADYPISGAKVTIKEVYLNDDGTPSDPAVLFIGRFEEIKDEDVTQFTIVAMNIKQANSLKATGKI